MDQNQNTTTQSIIDLEEKMPIWDRELIVQMTGQKKIPQHVMELYQQYRILLDRISARINPCMLAYFLLHDCGFDPITGKYEEDIPIKPQQKTEPEPDVEPERPAKTKVKNETVVYPPRGVGQQIDFSGENPKTGDIAVMTGTIRGFTKMRDGTYEYKVEIAGYPEMLDVLEEDILAES
jgi:hypothetical protein